MQSTIPSNNVWISTEDSKKAAKIVTDFFDALAEEDESVIKAVCWLLSAIRGPDDDFSGPILKSKLTCPIRSALMGSFVYKSCGFAPARQVFPRVKKEQFDLNHFISHADIALHVLTEAGLVEVVEDDAG